MSTVAELLFPGQLALEIGVSEKTLADWRCRGFGPIYVKVGRLIRYRRADVLVWLEENSNAPTRKEWKVGVPLPGRRSHNQQGHRLGGHRTKSEKGGAGRDQSSSGDRRRDPAPAATATERIH